MLSLFNYFLIILFFCVFGILFYAKFTAIIIILAVIFSVALCLILLDFGTIKKGDKMIYLNYGLYRHFFRLWRSNLFDSFKILWVYLIYGDGRKYKPQLRILRINNEIKPYRHLMVKSLNMFVGVDAKLQEDSIVIEAVDQKFLAKIRIQELLYSIKNINDDELIEVKKPIFSRHHEDQFL